MKSVNLRLSEEQHAELKQQAAASGLSLQKFLVMKLFGGVVVSRYEQVEPGAWDQTIRDGEKIKPERVVPDAVTSGGAGIPGADKGAATRSESDADQLIFRAQELAAKIGKKTYKPDQKKGKK